MVEGILETKEATHVSGKKKEKGTIYAANGQRMKRKASDERVSSKEKQEHNPKHDAGTMRSEGKHQETKPGTPERTQMQMRNS